MFRALVLTSLALYSQAQGIKKWDDCAAGDFLFANNGFRQCCKSTGLCKDSSCTVFGYKNSAKANCRRTGSDPNCPTSKCQYVNDCPKNSDGNHCYGTVVCDDPLDTSCYGYGKLCLEDGNSQRFKICDSACKKDRDCPRRERCSKGKRKTKEESICIPGPLSPEVGWNFNLKYQRKQLSPDAAVKILKEQFPSLLYVKLFDYNATVIGALRSEGVKNLVVSIPNNELAEVISTRNNKKYVKDIVRGLQAAQDDGIRVTIAIGNEPTLARYNTQYTSLLLQALSAVREALDSEGFENVRLTVPFDSTILGNSYPPKDGVLRSDVKDVVTKVAQFLAAEGSPFYVNLYPYFAYVASLSTAYPISLPYALLQEGHTTSNGDYYKNLLEAQVAAVRAALLRADPSLTEAKLRIVIGETGWPTAGEPHATVSNSKAFITNALNTGLDMYLFEAFDEQLKTEGSGSGSGVSDATEGSYGWLQEDGTTKYDLVAPESLTCDIKYPADNGEFADLSCPPTVLQGWIDAGVCSTDLHCGGSPDGTVCCPGLTKEAVMAACPLYVQL